MGTLKVVNFENPNRLIREGEGLWSARPNDFPEEVETRLEPESLESSNVNAITSMTEMIMIARAYEMFHRSIETYRSIDEKTATKLGS